MSNYTKSQCEERIEFYTDKINHFKEKSPENLHNISVYEKLREFWINQLKKL